MPEALDVARANIGAMRALVRGLAESGVRHACISPGSRSTPIVAAIAEQPYIDDTVVLDERAGGFFALGLAKLTGEPVAVVCTSGTAAANFYPAVAEASLACVPLVVLTADRPPELRGLGAPQTIDQVSLYGSHVRASTDVPPPLAQDYDTQPSAPDSYYELACSAVRRATRPAAGPVHLNLCFREPLIHDALVDTPAPRKTSATTGQSAAATRADECTVDFSRTADELSQTQRGIIVCGPLCCNSPASRERDAASVAELARRLGWPIIADVLSGLRSGRHDRKQIVAAHDVLLREPPFQTEYKPEYVLRLGAPPIVKSSHTWLAALSDVTQTVVCAPGLRLDHIGTADSIMAAEAGEFCRGVLGALPDLTDTESADGPTQRRGLTKDWLHLWVRAGETAENALQNGLKTQAALSEPAVAAISASSMPTGSVMFIGNSMPVRDLDSFAANSVTDFRVLCNRGANGIDGVISAALGAAAAGDKPTVAIVGDLCFLHDAAALQLAAQHAIDMTLVVINNNGGGVFSFLPQSTHPHLFERYFGTPHSLELGPIARSCGARHSIVESPSSFREALIASFERSGLDILEVPSDRAANVEIHRALLEAASNELRGFLAATGGSAA